MNKFHLISNSLYGALIFFTGLGLFAVFTAEAEGHKNHDAIPKTEPDSDPPALSEASVSSAVFDHNGRLWMAWVLEQRLYVNYSDDKGKSFSTPKQVSPESETVSMNPEARPNIALTDQGVIYVSYAQKLKQGFAGHVRFSRSLDDGKSFSTPLTVNDDDQFIAHGFASLAVNHQGDIYITWLDSRDSAAAEKAGNDYIGSAVYYARSDDEGVTFQPNVKIADHSCQCCRTVMAMNRDDLPVIMWRHIYGTDRRDHALVTFSSRSSFSQVQQVSDDEWHLDACPHHGPSLAVDSRNRYHISWFTNGKARQGVFYAYSDDQGENFSSPLPVGVIGQPARHSSLLVHGEQVYLTWKAFDGKSTALYIMSSGDRGASWSEPRVVTTTGGGSDHPFLLNNNNEIHLSWQTRDEGYRLLPVNALLQTLVENSVSSSSSCPAETGH